MHDDKLDSLSQGVAWLLRVIRQQHPDGPPPPPRDRFKGFQQNASGMWQFQHRVQQQQTPAGLGASIMDRFKR